METKSIWTSKTFWVNLIAAVALFVNAQWGFDLSPELQGTVLAVINIILRFFTKSAIA